MTFLPDFQLGIYNIYLALLSFMIVPRLVERFTGIDLKRAYVLPPMNKYEKVVYHTWLRIFPCILVVSLFIPFVHTPFLFPLGLVTSCIGLLMLISSKHTYATTADNKLIQTGLYKISRNPGYFSTALFLLGVSFMANSILVLMLTTLFFIMYQVIAICEERMCERIYQEEFMEYKNKTPRNFLFF